MKNLLSLSFLCLSTFLYSQKRETPNVVRYADFAYATETRDTLFLASGDPMSNRTWNVWKADPEWDGVNPVIVFVTQSELDRKKKAADKKN
jgi:hypothetical protein